MDTRPALLVIDMENGFLNRASALCSTPAGDMIPACTRVIDHCRRSGIPVFFIVRAYRADGSDVEHTRYGAWLRGDRALSPGCPQAYGTQLPEEFQACERDYLIVKPRYSAFFGTELDLILRRLRVDTLLLAGTATPNCVRTTCFDAISLEYNAVVLSDCTASATEEIQQSNLRDMGNVGAQIISSAQLMAGAELINSARRTQDAVARQRAQEK